MYCGQSGYCLNKPLIHIQMICCRITETFNKIINFLKYNFSKEQNVLPENDLRIEICTSILSVLM